ncbi:hypothetical protein [Rhizobium sullae]|uniref:hypothetical protein n=1 Tax=Rhizobium sullae TaxID=50338 RepID=UPI0012FE3576
MNANIPFESNISIVFLYFRAFASSQTDCACRLFPAVRIRPEPTVWRPLRPRSIFTAERVELTEALSLALAAFTSTSSAFSTAKSVAGLEGSLFGQATSPTFRALAGGMDTVMSAKAGARARSPLNISPGIADRLRVVVISISTRLDLKDVSATGVRTPFGCHLQPDRTMSIPHTNIR